MMHVRVPSIVTAHYVISCEHASRHYSPSTFIHTKVL